MAIISYTKRVARKCLYRSIGTLQTVALGTPIPKFTRRLLFFVAYFFRSLILVEL